jgi:NitT/TauT family transport system ATP-binding protein
VERKMITFTDVKKSFHGRPVFNGLSFHVREHEAVGLLGRSGVGKSTVLRMICGLSIPDSGTVRVRSTRIGYIFQEPCLIPWKTALDNIRFSLLAAGVVPSKAASAARETMERLDLKGFENHYPAQLSGGMCQRVSIGRAFAVSPDILLMDEPFSALDLGLKETMFGLVRDMLSSRPLTLLYVSHDPEEVSRLSDRLLLLSDGGAIREMKPGSDAFAKRTVMLDAFLKKQTTIRKYA